ncbi:hypothetical protein AAC387_Pa05g2970 [Persea americana]
MAGADPQKQLLTPSGDSATEESQSGKNRNLSLILSLLVDALCCCCCFFLLICLVDIQNKCFQIQENTTQSSKGSWTLQMPISRTPNAPRKRSKTSSDASWKSNRLSKILPSKHKRYLIISLLHLLFFLLSLSQIEIQTAFDVFSRFLLID